MEDPVSAYTTRMLDLAKCLVSLEAQTFKLIKLTFAICLIKNGTSVGYSRDTDVMSSCIVLYKSATYGA